MTHNPSWVPASGVDLCCFRIPFRCGRKPLVETGGQDNTDLVLIRKSNIVSLNGFAVDPIKFVDFYNESFFGNTLLELNGGRNALKQVWQQILKTIEEIQSHVPFSTNVLTAAATSFSFGLDENTDPVDERCLAHNFVAYLKTVLDKETFDKYIPPDLSEKSRHADGHAFSKPV